eukprot:scaffold24_cov186-Alexandrium_tamarense.AAC.52
MKGENICFCIESSISSVFPFLLPPVPLLTPLPLPSNYALPATPYTAPASLPAHHTSTPRSVLRYDSGRAYAVRILALSQSIEIKK